MHYAVNKLRSSLSRFSKLVKNVLFRSFFTSMCGSQWLCDFILESIQTDCTWPGTLVVGLWKTCRGERVLVVIRFNVTILHLRPYWEKCGLISWTMHKIQSDCSYHYSSLFLEYYNLILLECPDVSARTLQCWFEDACRPQRIRT